MVMDVLENGRAEFRKASGIDEMRRDKDGFLRLTPSAKRVDSQVDTLTTDISSLEDKLKRYRAQKAQAEKYQKSDEYKASKKKEKRKKKKKERNELLSMVFNNADHIAEEELEDDDDDSSDSNGSDKKGKSSKGSKKKSYIKETTLDTTYGKRFSPVVSMIYDSINNFDRIAREIEEELQTPQLRAKNMYRSTQISNMITAQNSRLSAVRQLADVATTISNLEYKKEKDKKSEEGSDTSKAISNLGAKYLRGGLDTIEERKSGGKKKKDKKASGNKKFAAYADDADDEDDDDYSGSIKESKRDKSDEADDRELASELAKALGKHKDIKFTAHERYASMDGTYTIMVVCDPLDPDNTAKFVAVDKKGKIIPNFKDDYPGLLPKKKNCRFVFDIGRRRVQDKNSGRTYKLMYDN